MKQAFATWTQGLAQRWQALQPRERLGLRWATGLLGLYLLWTAVLAPPWRLWRDAPARHQALEAQLQRMQAWRAEAEATRLSAAKAPEGWREGLTASVQALGSAELQWAGDAATVRLAGCSPAALGRWLAELGPQWRMRVNQASLRLNDEGLWQGQLTLGRP